MYAGAGGIEWYDARVGIDSALLRCKSQKAFYEFPLVWKFLRRLCFAHEHPFVKNREAYFITHHLKPSFDETLHKRWSHVKEKLSFSLEESKQAPRFVELAFDVLAGVASFHKL